jgi:hypothetical protein
VPNCDFYAVEQDAADVLEFIFSSTRFDVYELHSNPGHEVRRFSGPQDVMAAYNEAEEHDLHLALYSTSMEGKPKLRHIALNERRFGEPSFRYTTEGWGLIQLYLRKIRGGSLGPSHTNHNSHKRALAWEHAYSELGPVESWNWPEVTRLSRQLNRFIAKAAVSKLGSRPIMKGAELWRREGGVFRVNA